MFKVYVPTEDEIEMSQYKKELYYKDIQKDLNVAMDQDTLIIALVHAIRGFDYYYHYSDSASTWRSYDKLKDLILEKIKEVNDEEIKNHLSSCFHVEKSNLAGTIFPWGKFLYKPTPYNFTMWAGNDHNRTCWLLGLKEWVNKLNAFAKEGKCGGRVVYSNDIAKAVQLLQTETNWFDHAKVLKPAAVNDEFWKELSKFAKLYQKGIIRFTDLKLLFNHSVELSFTEKAEMLSLGYLYMLFVEK